MTTMFEGSFHAYNMFLIFKVSLLELVENLCFLLAGTMPRKGAINTPDKSKKGQLTLIPDYGLS